MYACTHRETRSYMHMYAHNFTHTHTHTHIHTYTHRCTHTHTYTHIYTQMHMRVNIHIYTHAHAHLHTHYTLHITQAHTCTGTTRMHRLICTHTLSHTTTGNRAAWNSLFIRPDTVAEAVAAHYGRSEERRVGKECR